jgi:hypothetical protein
VTAAGSFSGKAPRARRLDPKAFGPGDAWNLDFRCFAIRLPRGGYARVDAGDRAGREPGGGPNFPNAGMSCSSGRSTS